MAHRNAQPRDEAAHAREIEQPDVDGRRAEDIAQKAQRRNHGGGDQRHHRHAALVHAGEQLGRHALLGQRIQHAGGGVHARVAS